MDRLGAGLPGCGDDPLDHQIAFLDRGRADKHRLVGHAYVARARVGFEYTATARMPMRRAVLITRQAISRGWR